MKNNIKRTLAALCAVAAICTPLSSGTLLTGIVSPVTASAADTSEFTSGYSNRRQFYLDNEQEGYTLWFCEKNSNANTAVVTGCTTRKDSVFVTIPDTVTAQYNGKTYTVAGIGENAFRDQTRLASVSMDKHITEIGGFAFFGCTNLTSASAVSVTYGGCDYAVTKIGKKAFMNCEKLSGFSPLKDVTTIGEYAFYNCDTLNSLYLTKLSSMDSYAFSCCDSLIQVDMSQSPLTAIPDYAFQYCNQDRNSDIVFRLPSTLQTIGNYAFNNINSLKTINLPNVSSIGEYAFMDCHSLQTVMTGENLYYIGRRAFFGCDPMKHFVCKNNYVYIAEEALGYDDIRNYQGLKNNFTLWAFSTDSSAKRYADSQNTAIPFRTISEAASLARNNYVQYEWYRPNEHSYWGYGLNYRFIDKHQPYANGYYGKEFKGICSGMATVSALTSSGYLSVSDYAPGYDSIRSIREIPKDTRSYVTTVWANQSHDLVTYDHCASPTFSEEMLRYAENITYGGNAAVIGIKPNNSSDGHAVVCFGMEFKEYAADKNKSCWNGWDARLLIYDVNYGYHTDRSYIYVNLSDGTWSSQLADSYGGGAGHTTLTMTYTLDKLINQEKYNMTPDEFFAAIRN